MSLVSRSLMDLGKGKTALITGGHFTIFMIFAGAGEYVSHMAHGLDWRLWLV